MNPFPTPEFAWSLRMRGGSPDVFFEERDASGALLREKNHWLDTLKEHCLIETETSNGFGAQLWSLAKEWGQLERREEETLESLSRTWEADLIFLDAETFQVAGGCVCFPSSWSLEEATGKSLETVHGVVPGLNEALGDKVRRFLDKLAPGKAFHRANWGMTRSDDLNYHPVLQRPRLDETVTWSELYLRLEHQAFLRVESGIVLAVRIEPISLETLSLDSSDILLNLRSQLATMPKAVACYKGLEAAIPRMLQLIDQRAE
ncbi:MAG: heme-dependent oxidative N-demethylase subunit alpha family protein [Verrucomicrobiota bacterium]